MNNKIYVIFAAMILLVSTSAAAIDKFPEYIGTNPFPECRLTEHCLGNLGVYDRLEDLENQECVSVTYKGGGGGYGRGDVAEDLTGDANFFSKYDYFKDWLFENFVTKDELEQLYVYVELWMADGDPVQALLLKAIRLGHTVTEDGVTCHPQFGCISVISVE